MSKNAYLFTSESVSEGHPDKIADQLSDRILDNLILLDPNARAGIEALVTSNLVVLAGETSLINFREKIDLEDLVRNCIREIGYEDENFHWEKIEIIDKIHGQSGDIAQGVVETENKNQGAGDQGIMFGYATDETDSYMPAPLYFAHQILSKISIERKAGNLPELGPDAKSQVTMLYENDYPLYADKIIVSNQHNESAENSHVRDILVDVILTALPEGWIKNNKDLIINPTGRFVIGGPDGDAGLTGRKIIVDTYGGAAPHGGGAFSGKDPSKVDRSAAYATRHIAKNIVAAKLCDKALVQVSYAIGVSEPMGIFIDTFGTCNTNHNDGEIASLISKMDCFNLKPASIISRLKLKNPIYFETAAYGHMGRESELIEKTFIVQGKSKKIQVETFTWEKLDCVDEVKATFGIL